jgi:hypothetical protein
MLWVMDVSLGVFLLLVEFIIGAGEVAPVAPMWNKSPNTVLALAA